MKKTELQELTSVLWLCMVLDFNRPWTEVIDTMQFYNIAVYRTKHVILTKKKDDSMTRSANQVVGCSLGFIAKLKLSLPLVTVWSK